MSESDGKAESEAKAVGSFYAITGPYTERSFPVHAAGGLIGRSRRCPVSLLHDCEVSHNHAIVEPHAHASGFCIRDIGSTFGTYLNDKRLSEPKRASEPYKLKPGDTIKVGQTTLRWQPRQHLDAAASVLRIPPPPLPRDGASAAGGAGLDKVAKSLEGAHSMLCNAAAAVELAVVARRLEQLLRVQAQVDGARAGLSEQQAEWRALLTAECDSLRRDVGGLVGQQRECLRTLLGAQSAVWNELRLATAALAGGGGGAAQLSASAVQWLRDANHHARWGYRAIRQAQLWLDALEGAMRAPLASDGPASAALQRWRMLDADSRAQLSALNGALAAAARDARDAGAPSAECAREAVEARERLAVTEWELLLLARAHPNLAAGRRPALGRAPAALADVSCADGLALLLPWSAHVYAGRPACAPPPRAAAAARAAEPARYGREALLDGCACVLQQCRAPAAELRALHARLVRLAVRQASGVGGATHVAPIHAVWLDADATLYVSLAHGDARADAAGAVAAAAGGGRRASDGGGGGGGGFALGLSANWRRAFAELATALSALHAHGLCAAGLSGADIALDADGRVVLLALGLAQLGSAERPSGEAGWAWAAIPPEAHDAAAAAAAASGTPAAAPVAARCWSSDMWGVGVLLWRAHFGDDLRALEAFVRTARAERPASVPPPERADAQLAAVLGQLLHSEPALRLGACQLRAHALLQPAAATSRASSLPDAAAALLDDAARASEAIARARDVLADVRARARAAADARGRASVVRLRAHALCADLLAAARALPELELLGPLDVRLVADDAADDAAAERVCTEAALSLFWQRLVRDDAEPAVRAALFDAEVAPALAVGSATAAAGGAAAGALGASELACAQQHPGALVPAAAGSEPLLDALGRLLFKCVLDGLPLPLDLLPAYWWRAAVGLGASSGLCELEAVAPLLALQHHALVASGTTDGWALDFEQLGVAAADVPQARKLHWIGGKVRLDLWTSRARALGAFHGGFARAARAGAREPSDGRPLPLQGLPAEALMLLATGGVQPLARQLRAALVFRDFPEIAQTAQHLHALINLMSGVQLRRFILLLSGFVELPARRANGMPTVITVRYWPNANDCAPIAHRSALTLDLPWYSSLDKLKQMLCRTLDDMPEALPMNVYEPEDFHELSAKWICAPEPQGARSAASDLAGAQRPSPSSA